MSFLFPLSHFTSIFLIYSPFIHLPFSRLNAVILSGLEREPLVLTQSSFRLSRLGKSICNVNNSPSQFWHFPRSHSAEVHVPIQVQLALRFQDVVWAPVICLPYGISNTYHALYSSLPCPLDWKLLRGRVHILWGLLFTRPGVLSSFNKPFKVQYLSLSMKPSWLLLSPIVMYVTNLKWVFSNPLT